MNCFRKTHRRSPSSDDLPAVAPTYDGDPRFTLSAEETRWCVELREALRAAGVAEPRPDLMLAQFAIIGKGNVRKAVKRVKNYRKVILGEYGYSLEKARANGHFMNAKWPGMVLAAAPLSTGEPVVAVDVLPYRPSQLEWDTEWPRLIVEFVMIMDAVNCDLECIRKGGSMVIHMEGMGWHNFNLKMEEKAAPLYQEAYPCRFHSFPLVDAGPIATIIMRLVRAFLKKKIADRMIICKKSELYSSKYGYTREGLPPVLGGTYDRPLDEYISDLLQRRAEAESRVRVSPPSEDGSAVAPRDATPPEARQSFFGQFCGCGSGTEVGPLKSDSDPIHADHPSAD